MADLDAGVASYEKLGLECTQRMSNEDLGIHQAILPLADGGFIELVSPISDDSPVGKALARDGEGMHTIAFRATPLDEACEVIKASGATLIGEGGPQVFVRACRPLSALCSALLLLLTPAPAPAAVSILGLLLRLLRSSATSRAASHPAGLCRSKKHARDPAPTRRRQGAEAPRRGDVGECC